MRTLESAVRVENPATGAEIASVPELRPDQVDELAARARAAQPAWDALGFAGRREVLLNARGWLLDHADEVIETLVAETGKSWEDAQLVELAYGASALGFWAANAERYLATRRVRTGPSPFVLGKRLSVSYRPIGLVGVIGPWNFPLINSFGDCLPALAAGNAVILKPSEVTPLTSLLLARGLREAGLPQDVLQVATGGATTGEAVVDAVDMVMFTGSTATGRKVMERAASTLTRVSLELGGKDAMIVLADADLERAANAAVWGAFQNGGQTCLSLERVFVEQPVYDEFVARVSAEAARVRCGRPTGPGSVEVGAITFPPQIELIDAHVRDAVARGARVLLGGERLPGDGRFYPPTVLVDVDPGMRIMREETFGPVLPIMRVRDADEALALANDSEYGLGGAVFGGDRRRAESIASRLEAGAVCVNDALTNYVALELPMGGVKSSGIGSRHGPDGIRKYCAQQSMLVSRVHLRRDLHMFPYSRRRTRLFMRGFRVLWRRRGGASAARSRTARGSR